MYRSQTNPVDEAAMQRSMAMVVSELAIQGVFPPGSTVLSTSTDNWKLNSYMLGVGTISELNNKDIKVYTKMMLGLCSGSSPSVQTMVTNTNNTYEDFTVNMLSGDANNFAALFGVGLRIHAGESVDLLVSGDYFTSNLEFEDVRVELLGQYSPPQTIKQSVDIMSLSLGLVFKL